MKNLKMHKYGGRITNVPIDVEPMDVEQENVEDIRAGRPEKKVTWSRKLESVRSISPRQKTPRTSRMSEAVNTLRGGPSLTQEGAGVKDCGHFLCQRVGGVCLQGEESAAQQQQKQQGNLRPGYQNLPCSPQMQTVVWRSIPISRATNNNNNKSNNNNKR